MNRVLRKLFLLVVVSGVSYVTNAQGFEPTQGFKQINFGVGVSNWGVPVYAGMDFGIADKITIGPRISYRSYSKRYSFFTGGYDIDYTIFNLSFRGDYHYGAHISGLPDQLDLYGGLSLGYSVWSHDYDGPGDPSFEDSDVYIALQAGARWYFNQNWGANAELTGGTLSGLEIGLSYRF
ncbi:hypothetical protein C900_04764 [Fulvivirga imtechensis AK7]|uniref:Outer membrane protein beta-barrel domain-containing protein n=1 Tax=Fulvivirga imtechensis AK7 TaxID=1237149 RepID=L8JYM7_9BACT|nr:outer membrane beta-barrel protein [Fulvivirga imtechensis]ELR73253.1 hypothetical protein C900_04764 [Fulvivirga imtechensis AK7]